MTAAVSEKEFQATVVALAHLRGWDDDIAASAVDRFWPKVHQVACGGCWLWTAFTDAQGYGRLRVGGRSGEAEYAHRLSLWMVGVVTPTGMHVDHLCRVRSCVNPTHLEVVTPRVNAERSTNRHIATMMSGACERGHDRATHGYRRKDRPGAWNCNECRRLRRAGHI